MRIAFVIDPLDGLDPSIDTTVGLMHAAQDRGAEVWVTQARLLEAAHGRARADARRVRLAPSRPLSGHRWTVARRWFTATGPQRVWLDEMTAVWRGERGVGPPPAHDGRPGLLIGGSADVTYQRVAQYADGWTMGGGTPDTFGQAVEKLRAAWTSAGREGTPRTMALFYFALGDDAEEMASDSLGDYYAFLGDIAKQIVAGAAKDSATVRQYIAAFEAAGADEVICFPASADLSQVDLLAEAALG